MDDKTNSSDNSTVSSNTIDDPQEIARQLAQDALQNNDSEPTVKFTSSIDKEINELTANMKPNHVLFTQHVFEGKTHKQAYMLSSPTECSEKSAGEAGTRLSKREDVQELMDLYKKRAIIETGVTTERVVSELAAIGFGNITDIFDFYEEDGKTKVKLKSPDSIDTKSIKSINIAKGGEVKIQLYNKESCLQKLGEYLGIFNNEKTQFKDKTYEEALTELVNNKTKESNLHEFNPGA